MRNQIIWSISLLVLLFLLTIPSNFTLDKNFKNEKYFINEHFDKDGKLLPKTSSNELILITPQNKTYTSPMEGYYPGTYSFDSPSWSHGQQT